MLRSGLIRDDNRHMALPPGATEGVLRIGREVWSPAFRYAGGSPGRFTCGLVVAGCVLAEFPDRAWRIPAGHACCWDGRHRVLRPEAGSRPELLLVTVASGPIEALAARCLGLTAGAVPLADPGPVRRQLTAMVAEAGGAGRYRAELAFARVPELIWRMAAARHAAAGGTAGYDRYAQCVRLAERRFRDLRSVADLAALAGISSAHCCRLFRRQGGGSPLRLLTRLRLLAAVEELARGSSVGAVAEQLGYPDPFTFSKAFTRFHGQPPSRFRQVTIGCIPAPPRRRQGGARA